MAALALASLALSSLVLPFQAQGRPEPAVHLNYQLLAPGARVERLLTSPEHHSYRMELRAGEVLNGAIKARGIQLTTKVLDPSGHDVAHVGSGQVFAPFSVVAATAGTYKVEVSSPEAQSQGHYILWVKKLNAFEYARSLDRREFGEDSAMFQIADQVRNQGETAVDSVFAERQGRGPIVEPDPADPKQRIVTFLYHGGPTTETVDTWAFTIGTAPLDMNEEGTMPMNFRRLGGSSLWYLRVRLPSDTLMGYQFEVTRSQSFKTEDGQTLAIRSLPDLVSDPLVSNVWYGTSILRLPNAPAQPWIKVKPEVAQGSCQPQEFVSRSLHEMRRFTVYTPPDYETKTGDCPLVFVLDGETYGPRRSAIVPTPRVLNNLIAEGRIPPTVAVFVDSQASRSRDYVNSAPFRTFMAQELLPWVQKHYRVSHDPGQVVVAGSSLGGLCATDLAFQFPNAFGNVLSQSGAFYPSPGLLSASSSFEKIRKGYALVNNFIEAPRKPIRFYMDCGLFEGPLLEGDRHLRDVLKLKGYPLTYVEHSGSHDYVYWRNSIGDGLIALLGDKHEAAVRRWAATHHRWRRVKKSSHRRIKAHRRRARHVRKSADE